MTPTLVWHRVRLDHVEVPAGRGQWRRARIAALRGPVGLAVVVSKRGEVLGEVERDPSAFGGVLYRKRWGRYLVARDIIARGDPLG